MLWTLFSFIFLPEFVRPGAAESSSFVYIKVAGGFRLADIAVLGLGMLHATALACRRRATLACLPRELIAPGLLFLGCIAIGILYGRTNGGTNFFFDWRGIALAVALFSVWRFWIRSSADIRAAAGIFAIYVAARIAIVFWQYVAGHGDTLFGVPIPLFDGPIISTLVFTALLAMQYLDSSRNGMARACWMLLAASSALLVLLAFRRTYWGELSLGGTLSLLLLRKNRFGKILLVGATILLAALILGQSFSGRLASLLPQDNDSEFTASNADHVDDLADAWEQIRQSPVMGIGVGTSYVTWRIRSWKTEAVMVHNAPLHVWLKYGIAGMVSYLWFHIALLAWIFRARHSAIPENRPFLNAAFAYLTAQFVMTLSFAPWPYSELQLTVLLSFVTTSAFIAASLHRSRRSPANHASRAIGCNAYLQQR
jgi:O-antigen ligase